MANSKEKIFEYIEQLENEIQALKQVHEYDVKMIDEVKGNAVKLYKEIDELEEKSARGMEYFGQDRWSFPYSKGTICDIIHRITRTKVHYTEKRKLEKEFGGVLSERKRRDIK